MLDTGDIIAAMRGQAETIDALLQEAKETHDYKFTDQLWSEALDNVDALRDNAMVLRERVDMDTQKWIDAVIETNHKDFPTPRIFASNIREILNRLSPLGGSQRTLPEEQELEEDVSTVARRAIQRLSIIRHTSAASIMDQTKRAIDDAVTVSNLTRDDELGQLIYDVEGALTNAQHLKDYPDIVERLIEPLGKHANVERQRTLPEEQELEYDVPSDEDYRTMGEQVLDYVHERTRDDRFAVNDEEMSKALDISPRDLFEVFKDLESNGMIILSERAPLESGFLVSLTEGGRQMQEDYLQRHNAKRTLPEEQELEDEQPEETIWAVVMNDVPENLRSGIITFPTQLHGFRTEERARDDLHEDEILMRFRGKVVKESPSSMSVLFNATGLADELSQRTLPEEQEMEAYAFEAGRISVQQNGGIQYNEPNVSARGRRSNRRRMFRQAYNRDPTLEEDKILREAPVSKGYYPNKKFLKGLFPDLEVNSIDVKPAEPALPAEEAKYGLFRKHVIKFRNQYSREPSEEERDILFEMPKTEKVPWTELFGSHPRQLNQRTKVSPDIVSEDKERLFGEKLFRKVAGEQGVVNVEGFVKFMIETRPTESDEEYVRTWANRWHDGRMGYIDSDNEKAMREVGYDPKVGDVKEGERTLPEEQELEESWIDILVDSVEKRVSKGGGDDFMPSWNRRNNLLDFFLPEGEKDPDVYLKKKPIAYVIKADNEYAVFDQNDNQYGRGETPEEAATMIADMINNYSRTQHQRTLPEEQELEAASVQQQDDEEQVTDVRDAIQENYKKQGIPSPLTCNLDEDDTGVLNVEIAPGRAMTVVSNCDGTFMTIDPDDFVLGDDADAERTASSIIDYVSKLQGSQRTLPEEQELEKKEEEVVFWASYPKEWNDAEGLFPLVVYGYESEEALKAEQERSKEDIETRSVRNDIGMLIGRKLIKESGNVYSYMATGFHRGGVQRTLPEEQELENENEDATRMDTFISESRHLSDDIIRMIKQMDAESDLSVSANSWLDSKKVGELSSSIAAGLQNVRDFAPDVKQKSYWEEQMMNFNEFERTAPLSVKDVRSNLEGIKSKLAETLGNSQRTLPEEQELEQDGDGEDDEEDSEDEDPEEEEVIDENDDYRSSKTVLRDQFPEGAAGDLEYAEATLKAEGSINLDLDAVEEQLNKIGRSDLADELDSLSNDYDAATTFDEVEEAASNIREALDKVKPILLSKRTLPEEQELEDNIAELRKRALMKIEQLSEMADASSNPNERANEWMGSDYAGKEVNDVMDVLGDLATQREEFELDYITIENEDSTRDWTVSDLAGFLHRLHGKVLDIGESARTLPEEQELEDEVDLMQAEAERVQMEDEYVSIPYSGTLHKGAYNKKGEMRPWLVDVLKAAKGHPEGLTRNQMGKLSGRVNKQGEATFNLRHMLHPSVTRFFEPLINPKGHMKWRLREKPERTPLEEKIELAAKIGETESKTGHRATPELTKTGEVRYGNRYTFEPSPAGVRAIFSPGKDDEDKTPQVFEGSIQDFAEWSDRQHAIDWRAYHARDHLKNQANDKLPPAGSVVKTPNGVMILSDDASRALVLRPVQTKEPTDKYSRWETEATQVSGIPPEIGSTGDDEAVLKWGLEHGAKTEPPRESWFLDNTIKDWRKTLGGRSLPEEQELELEDESVTLSSNRHKDDVGAD